MNRNENIKVPLKGSQGENPFKVPEGYFDSLQDRIEARIEAEETTLTKKQQVLRILKPVLTMAASFALAFLLLYYPIRRLIPEYIESHQATNTNDMPTDEDILIGLMDDTFFYESLNEEPNTSTSNNEEVLAYLSVEMSDYEVLNELTKQ